MTTIKTNCFSETMEEHGMLPNAGLEYGRVVRCPTADHPKNKSFAYQIKPDMSVGWFRNYEEGGEMIVMVADSVPSHMTSPRPSRAEIIREERRRDEQTKRILHKMRGELSRCKRAHPNHPYLMRKKISNTYFSQNGELLVAALENIHGEIMSFQTISPSGNKRFYAGLAKSGLFFKCWENVTTPSVVHICEGIATAITVCTCIGGCVVAAMDCGNILSVCKAFREKYPQIHIVICADNDEVKKGRNIGVQKALQASQLFNAEVKVPVLPEVFSKKKDKFSDFNDLYCIAGLEEATRQLLK